jgi:tRNA dimethylallyltransferase
METKRKIIIILGPTSSGKSELGVKIARNLSARGGQGGEIISADSRQIYKGLDVGSGKIEGKWTKNYKLKPKTSNFFVYKKIVHHCLDYVPPKKIYSAAEYKKCADEAIEDILSQSPSKGVRKTPIIVGGTGLYIDAILGKTQIAQVEPDWELRKKLEKKSVEQLFKMLQKLDPKRAKNIDPKNPRRLIRAIEVARHKPPLNLPLVKVETSPSFTRRGLGEVDFLQIGIKPSDEQLRKNIEKRVKKMLDSGLLKEVETLHKPIAKGGYGLTWKRVYELGFEYKYPAMFLRKQISYDEMFQKMLTENWRYAKRQMTWFKRDKNIKWLALSEVEGSELFKQAEELVEKF